METFRVEMLLKQCSDCGLILKLIHANLNLFTVFHYRQTTMKYWWILQLIVNQIYHIKDGTTGWELLNSSKLWSCSGMKGFTLLLNTYWSSHAANLAHQRPVIFPCENAYARAGQDRLTASWHDDCSRLSSPVWKQCRRIHHDCAEIPTYAAPQAPLSVICMCAAADRYYIIKEGSLRNLGHRWWWWWLYWLSCSKVFLPTLTACWNREHCVWDNVWFQQPLRLQSVFLTPAFPVWPCSVSNHCYLQD